MSAARLALVALLVALAGCANAPAGPSSAAPPESSTTVPTATTAPTTTDRQATGETTAEPSTTVGGTDGVTTRPSKESPVNVTLVFERVLDLTGTQAEQPTVSVIETEMATVGEPAGFVATMGIVPEPDTPLDGINGRYADATHRVVVDESLVDDPALFERVLAHEYAHAVQYESASFQEAFPREFPDANRPLLMRAAVEGPAEYVQRTYSAEHAPEAVRTFAAVGRAYRNASAFLQYAIAPYYFGERYVRFRVDSPRDLDAFYRNPPNSTEQLLHNETPGEEPPERIGVEVDDSNSTWSSTTYGQGTKGELFLRIALSSELSWSEAADAAAGWGGDTLVTLKDYSTADPSNTTSYAWAIRWDSPAEASEFEASFGEYLDSRATQADGVWRDEDASFRSVRVGDSTVVVFAGEESFVRGATVSGNASEVTVSPP